MAGWDDALSAPTNTSVIPALVAGTPGSAHMCDASGPPAVRPLCPCGGQRGSCHKGGNDG
ncbi:hypothetical protein CSW59_00770 [Caulobacter sp. BP25]|nr:hypothetical protein CSW59_00770 [Caulobacter sp. BP25]